MQEGGVSVDDATITGWVVHWSPQLQEACHPRTRPVWRSWRMDEASIRVKGHWYSRDRAVDTSG
jgi:putative transposase